jgi:hypothetical protein
MTERGSIELTYRFEPEHLHLYRRFASDRGIGGPATGREGEDSFGLFLICALVLAAFLAGADVIFPGVTGRPFAFIEFVAGLLSGVAIALAVLWWRYRRFARAALRPDGPTLAEHRLSVSADGLRTTSRFVEGLYRWSAVEDMTVRDGIIVLWIEPSAGVLVPRGAFASPAAEADFLEAVRGYMATTATPSPKR